MSADLHAAIYTMQQRLRQMTTTYTTGHLRGAGQRGKLGSITGDQS